MEKITAYKVSDGRIFESAEVALDYEYTTNIENNLKGFLKASLKTENIGEIINQSSYIGEMKEKFIEVVSKVIAKDSETVIELLGGEM